MTRSVFTDEYAFMRQSLKKRRNAIKMTQKKLAEKVNMCSSFVGKYEQGERRLDVIELLYIAEALEIDVCELLSGVREIVRQKMQTAEAASPAKGK